MENKENVWIMTVVKREGFDEPCLEMSPHTLQVVKGRDKESRTVRIVADPANPIPITLELRNGPLDFYFGDAPEDTREIYLEPGQEGVFCLKARLGLVQRKNLENRFTSTDSPYALVLKFDHPGLTECGHGFHTDMHMEC